MYSQELEEKLKEIVNDYVDYVNSDDYHEDNDYAHFIFEAAVEAVRGKNIWKEMKN